MSNSSLRDRHWANRQTETKKQFVVFWLRRNWFAIPIKFLRRIIPIEVEVPVITEAGTEISIIDISEKIFSPQISAIDNTSDSKSLKFGDIDVSAQRSLILLQTPALVAILVDSQPVLFKFSDIKFIPLIEIYKSRFNHEFIKLMISESNDDSPSHPPIFLIDPNLI